MAPQQAGEPQPTKNPYQHADRSDHATEYSTSNAPRRHIQSPDRTEYSTPNTVYSARPHQPPQRQDDTTHPQQQPQATPPTIDAVQSQDDHKHNEQRLAGCNNTSATTSDGPAAQSQTSSHSSCMDIDSTSDPPRRQQAPGPLPSGLDVHGGTPMGLDKDIVQSSIQSILLSAACAPALQRPACSLYRALDEA